MRARDWGTRRQLTFGNTSALWFCGWHPDGKEILYSAGETPENFTVWSTTTDNAGDPKQLLKAGEAVYSPDGKILLYTQTAERSLDLWYKNLQDGQSKPFLKSAIGDELFFAEGKNIMSVPVQLKPAFSRGNPQKLFTREGASADRPFNYADGYDVSADGKVFVMLQNAEESKKEASIQTINIVQNWFAEFKNK